MSYYNQNPTRKAILIGCPGTDKSYLAGVQQDLKNVSKFLLTEKGGAWYENEIITLNDPIEFQLNQTIQDSLADYVLVYFSGHGYTESNSNQRMLCLKDSVISDKRLLNNSPKQLVLIDACRNYISIGISGLPDYEPQWDYATGIPDARAKFNDYIINSPDGKMIIHGTQIGEYSYDSSNGGLFTNALLYCSTRINTNIDYSGVFINKVINLIPQYLSNKGNNQVPSIAYNQGNLTVPFALGMIKRNYPKVKEPVVQMQIATSNNNSTNAGWLLFGLGVLTLLIVAGNSK